MPKGQESILDLASSVDKKVIVHFNGGRVCTGVLKGYDELVNLVLSDTVEDMGEGEERKLGLIVARGTQVQRVVDDAGRAEIETPCAGEEEEVEDDE